MKQRLISAAVALLVLAAVLFLADTIVLNTAIALLSAAAVYEVLRAAGCMKPRAMGLLCVAAAFGIPFLSCGAGEIGLTAAAFAYSFGMMIILLVCFDTLRVEKLGFAFFVSIMVPVAMSVIVCFRDKYADQGTGVFYILLLFVGAFMTDTGAYIGGRLFGKRKLAPKISPNKTIGGAVSGIVTCLISMPLYCLIYSLISAGAGAPVTVDYLRVMIISPVAALMAIAGDLSASLIKRQCGVKDFGSIMPGHGGVMDRFDSVLFVAPTLLIYTHFLPLI